MSNEAKLFEEEKCSHCGKIFMFGVQMNRSTYQWKQRVNRHLRYYCSYGCMRADKQVTRAKRKKW